MSKLTLCLAKPNEAGLLHRMQQASFTPILEQYQGLSVCDSVEQIFTRITEQDSYYYLILLHENPIGGLRVLDRKDGSPKRILPVFLLPQHQHHGYGTQAILLAEQLHGAENWQLETIWEEKRLCRFYESLGYRQTGEFEIINERLTLVYYKK